MSEGKGTCKVCGAPISGSGRQYCENCVPPITVGGGYVKVYRPDHHAANAAGYVPEHWIVAEEKLGRELLPGEVVHHEDGNPQNNNPDNLRVFPNQTAHGRYHTRRRHERLSAEIRALTVDDWRWLWTHHYFRYRARVRHLTKQGMEARAARKAAAIAHYCFRQLVLNRKSTYSSSDRFLEDVDRTWPIFLSFILALVVGTHSWSDRFIAATAKRIKALVPEIEEVP